LAESLPLFIGTSVTLSPRWRITMAVVRLPLMTTT
jgi:hypothetical protein